MKAALRGLTHRFWAVPLLFAVAAAALALGVTAIDDSLDTALACRSCSPVAQRARAPCSRRSSPR